VNQQVAEHEAPPESGTYRPSEELIRLNNAINRGLEYPEHPEDIIGLILQGITARYDCFSSKAAEQKLHRLTIQADNQQTVSHITTIIVGPP